MSDLANNPMGLIFKHLAISILFMFVGFLVGQLFIPPSMIFYANIIFAILMIAFLIMSLLSRKNIIPRRFSMNFVYLFTFIDGVLLYPLLQYYLQDLGTNLFISIVVSTTVLFAILAKVANKKEAGHYIKFGNVLFASLVGLLIASGINLFIGGEIFNLVISMIGVLIFSGYVLYDVSLIKYEIEQGLLVDRDDLSIHVLNLYLDFINILLDLLEIVSSLKD